MQLNKNVIINGEIELITGLNIGTNKESLRIGGIDSPVIKNPVTQIPYIPGSSLKGKMRFSIELKDGKYDIELLKNEKNEIIDKKGVPHAFVKECKDQECQICVVFGSTKNTQAGLTRLIVRDSLPLSSKSYGTEIKVENSIDRLQGKAISPRFIERVTAGSRFKLEMVYSIYGSNNDHKLIETVFNALSLVEDSYLGSSGSRGYGQVKFHITKIYVRDTDFYKAEAEEKVIFDGSSSPQEILSTKVLEKL